MHRPGEGMFKKFVQQGRSRFDERSVLIVRERERRWRLFSTFP